MTVCVFCLTLAQSVLWTYLYLMYLNMQQFRVEDLRPRNRFSDVSDMVLYDDKWKLLTISVIVTDRKSGVIEVVSVSFSSATVSDIWS